MQTYSLEVKVTLKSTSSHVNGYLLVKAKSHREAIEKGSLTMAHAIARNVGVMFIYGPRGAIIGSVSAENITSAIVESADTVDEDYRHSLTPDDIFSTLQDLSERAKRSEFKDE